MGNRFVKSGVIGIQNKRTAIGKITQGKVKKKRPQDRAPRDTREDGNGWRVDSMNIEQPPCDISWRGMILTKNAMDQIHPQLPALAARDSGEHGQMLWTDQTAP